MWRLFTLQIWRQIRTGVIGFQWRWMWALMWALWYIARRLLRTATRGVMLRAL
jgi:hypothetical protein